MLDCFALYPLLPLNLLGPSSTLPNLTFWCEREIGKFSTFRFFFFNSLPTSLVIHFSQDHMLHEHKLKGWGMS